MLRQILGVGGPPATDEIAEHVRYAVDTMMRAWSTAAEAASADKAGGKKKV